MTFTPTSGNKIQKWNVYDFKGPGIGLGMFNTDASITGTICVFHSSLLDIC